MRKSVTIAEEIVFDYSVLGNYNNQHGGAPFPIADHPQFFNRSCFQEIQHSQDLEFADFKDPRTQTYHNGRVENPQNGQKIQLQLANQLSSNPLLSATDIQGQSLETAKAKEAELSEISNCHHLLRKSYNSGYFQQANMANVASPFSKKNNQDRVLIAHPFEFQKDQTVSTNPRKYTIIYNKESGCIYSRRQGCCSIKKCRVTGRYSGSVCMDAQGQIFFLYNNQSYEVEMYSYKAGKTKYKVRTHFERKETSLYFHQQKSTLYVIGGYTRPSPLKSQVQGSSQIQVYKVSLKQIRAELEAIVYSQFGRFEPIIFPATLNRKEYLIILGGISKGSLNRSRGVIDERKDEPQYDNFTADFVNIATNELCSSKIHCDHSMMLAQGMAVQEGSKLFLVLPHTSNLIITIIKENHGKFTISLSHSRSFLEESRPRYTGLQGKINKSRLELFNDNGKIQEIGVYSKDDCCQII